MECKKMCFFSVLILMCGCEVGESDRNIGKNSLPEQNHRRQREIHLLSRQVDFVTLDLPSGKLTWQWKTDHLKMYFLLKMGIFQCYVSLPECNMIS